MELRQLRYLEAIGDLGSFSAAARRLHVVQPAVSQQIRKLEAELGVELVRRTSPVALTPLGERVCRRARTVLAEIDRIHADVGEALGTVGGRLRIGSMRWLGPVDLALLLGAFAQRHPVVEIALQEATTPAMLAAVRAGELDLSFVSLTRREWPRGFDGLELANEELVVAGAPGTLPDEPGGVRARFLDGRPFVAFAEGMSLRATVDAALGADVVPHVVLESNEPLTVRELVARGLGFALLPHSIADAPGAPLATLSVAPEAITRTLALVWVAGRRLSPAADAFVALVLEREQGRAQP